MKPNLYALLVGINSYPGITLENGVVFPRLNGCVDDVAKVAAYLRQDSSFTLQLKTLINEQATKTNVVRQFREHLTKARKGDVALFYFSGHGAQEWADREVWITENDQRLECLVCYFDDENHTDFKLADKELRHLLYPISLAQPHLVTLFDCCHSGNNTRNISAVQAAFSTDRPIAKHIPYVFKQRPWSQFIFHTVLSREQIIQNGVAVSLPEADHIQLSACESDESALEISGEGVFTKMLLKVLETTAGDITYAGLQNRVRHYLHNVYQQKPTLSVTNENSNLPHTVFLNKAIRERPAAFGEVVRNRQGKWILNMGGIHGLTHQTQFTMLVDPEQPEKKAVAKCGQLWTDTAELLPDPAVASILTNDVYKVLVNGLLIQSLPIHVINSEGTLLEQRLLLDKLFQDGRGFLAITDDEHTAHYTVRAWKGHFLITYPRDPFRPLVAPVNVQHNNALDLLLANLRHLAQWEHLKNLKNRASDSTVSPDALQVDFFRIDTSGQAVPIPVNEHVVTITYDCVNEEWKAPLQIRLTNTTPNSLYCSVLYLTSSFGALRGLLSPNVIKLEQVPVYLSVKEKPAIDFRLTDLMRFYNWPVIPEYFQFIVSSEPFDVTSLQLERLPRPVFPNTDRSRSTAPAKIVFKSGFRVDDWDNESKPKGWVSVRYRLELINPNLADEHAVQAMYDDPRTVDFARELYGK